MLIPLTWTESGPWGELLNTKLKIRGKKSNKSLIIEYSGRRILKKRFEVQTAWIRKIDDISMLFVPITEYDASFIIGLGLLFSPLFKIFEKPQIHPGVLTFSFTAHNSFFRDIFNFPTSLSGLTFLKIDMNGITTFHNHPSLWRDRRGGVVKKKKICLLFHASL